VKTILELCKTRIAFLAALSTGCGWLLAAGRLTPALMTPVTGVFLLAAGAGALNQYQDRRTDALMARTCARPLPSGRMSPRAALHVALLLIGCGALLLFSVGNLSIFGLGLSALFWYNGVYAWLKRRTPWAAVPGALVGSIPPVIGWVAGGGLLFDPRVLVVAFFFFLWQIPHFWLLVLNHAADFAEAPLPSPASVFSPAQLTRITFVWILASALSSLLLPVFGMIRSAWIPFALIGGAAWLVWNASAMLGKGRREGAFPFQAINLYPLWVIAFIFVDRVLASVD
jgi:protoheme IX farnesyltransferase